MAFSRRPRLLKEETSAPPRAKEVQVLVLGMSRTAIKVALQKLGFTPYHMSEAVMKWRERHLHHWLAALRAKYQGRGRPFGEEEFDRLLGDYDGSATFCFVALTDIPCINFVDELVSAYPNAKVILTNRDVDKWLVSMDKTFYTVMKWRSMGMLAAVDKDLIGPYWALLRIIMNSWTKGNWEDRGALRQGYLNHYAHVRAVVAKENLLEFKSEDGWEPLCAFLGKPVPKDEPYPRVNDGDSVVKLHGYLFWYRLMKIVLRFGGILLAVAVALGTVWYYAAVYVGNK